VSEECPRHCKDSTGGGIESVEAIALDPRVVALFSTTGGSVEGYASSWWRLPDFARPRLTM
jgi:hypothetical protein